MKAKEYYMLHREDRREWRLSFPQTCMICGWDEDRSSGLRWLEVHEIERRSQAQKRWAHRCNYLLLCNECHRDRIPLMDHAEQLAYKWRADQTHFDLTEWLKVKDPDLRAPNRVTLDEVESFL